MPSLVSIIQTFDYDREGVYRAVREAIDHLGGIERYVKNGDRILLKPNLLSAKPPERAATTHPAIVDATIRLVRDAGATPVVGDSPAIGGTEKVAEKAGILDVCRQYGVELLGFQESVSVENPNGRYKSLLIAKDALEVDGIINLPKIKTHAQMFLTLSVKNLFGCIIGRRKAQWHLSAGRDRMAFARIFIDLYNILKPRLHIADGIVAMEGNGPGSGDPRQLGLLFASSDGIALDRVITDVLGARDEDMPTTCVAIKHGMTNNHIEVRGKTVEEVRVKDFRFPPLMDVEWDIPEFFKKRLKNSITPRPVIDQRICTLCSLCRAICPPKIMKLTDNRIDIDYDMCIRCFCCQEVCPEGAIISKEGWLARILVR